MRTSFLCFDRRLAAGLLAGLIFATGALAQKPAKSVTLSVNKQAIRAEVVQTDAERERGLMFREKLGHDDGMLFIFDDPGYHSMWMMNTLIPLSVAFIDRDGVILNVEEMEPQTTDAHTAAGPAKYALEMNKGWFAEKKVKPGDKVAGIPGVRPRP